MVSFYDKENVAVNSTVGSNGAIREGGDCGRWLVQVWTYNVLR